MSTGNLLEICFVGFVDNLLYAADNGLSSEQFLSILTVYASQYCLMDVFVLTNRRW